MDVRLLGANTGTLCHLALDTLAEVWVFISGNNFAGASDAAWKTFIVKYPYNVGIIDVGGVGIVNAFVLSHLHCRPCSLSASNTIIGTNSIHGTMTLH